MYQYKLYELFDCQETYGQLYEKFEEEDIVKFSSKLVGIKYDYENRGYSDVVQKVIDLNLRQFIITSKRFLKFIEYSIEKKRFIKEICFIESIPKEEKEIVDEFIRKINRVQDIQEKNKIKNKLFKELEWVVSDECIDIKNSTITIFDDEKKINYSLSLYHNGVIFIDNEDVIKLLKEEIIEEIY